MTVLSFVLLRAIFDGRGVVIVANVRGVLDEFRVQARVYFLNYKRKQKIRNKEKKTKQNKTKTAKIAFYLGD